MEVERCSLCNRKIYDRRKSKRYTLRLNINVSGCGRIPQILDLVFHNAVCLNRWLWKDSSFSEALTGLGYHD